jgi:hypothetical protein
MLDPKEVVPFLLWLSKLDEMGDVFVVDRGLIWKKAGKELKLFWCQDFDIFPLSI